MGSNGRKAVAVRVRVGEAIGQGLQKRNDLVFFLVRQSKITGRCINIFGGRTQIDLDAQRLESMPSLTRFGTCCGEHPWDRLNMR